MWRLLLAASVMAGCSPFGGDCGEDGPFEPGTFVSTGGRWINGSGRISHSEGRAKRLVLEQRPDNSALVRITYQRGGKTIVETWQQAPDRTFPWATLLPGPQPVRLSHTQYDFGAVPLQTSRSVSVSVVGDLPATTTVTLVGDGYTMSHDCVGPRPGCSIELQFRPTSPGLAEGTLTVTPPPAAPMTVRLSGWGFELRDAGPDAAGDGAPPDATPD